MKIYAIGDLHLSFKKNITVGKWEDVEEYKSMGIFGENWVEHYRKIYQKWQSHVDDTDIVLIPGDISWAMSLGEMKADLDFIEKLSGKKVFIRGNHDYWWQGINKMRSFFPDDCFLIQNDSISFGDTSIAGSRGWTAPNSYQYTEHDEKIFLREINRLELSLKSIGKAEKIIAMTHYMPVNEQHEYNQLIELMQDYQVDICIYGHLHGVESHKNRLDGVKWGIDFRLVSSDFLDFRPELICSI